MALGLREGNGSAAEEVRASSCYAYDGTPPPAHQMMDRHPPVVLGADHDDGRIPASVFERDASDPSKDWSMMSTESVFGLQVAPSCDFTGYFLAHPELMDIATPPRDSSFGVGVATPHAAASPSRPFETIPELGNAGPSYSFAFPKLMDDKGLYSASKKNQSREQPLTPKASASSPAPPAAEANSKKGAPKGGMFSWMPCCS
uniref:Uncharacterized protein n=1 Tax=Avena sativa TaxID=4498 RepID=A0ACD5XZR1_AVESA